MKSALLLMLLLSVPLATANTTASVEKSMFMPGNYWRWLYSDWDESDQVWKPYYIEKYTVTKVDGDKITIEMSSSPAFTSVFAQNSEPHHKFILDFRKCKRAAADPRYKNFTVELYTKSLSENWELVSRSHKGLVFTEKFNCTKPFPHQQVKYQEHRFKGEVLKTFRMIRYPSKKGSWYILSRPGLEGIAASKLFPPNGQYKFELLDYGF